MAVNIEGTTIFLNLYAPKPLLCISAFLFYGIRCKCHRGFEGEFCELEIDECERLIPCVHGSCQDLVGDYSCSCERGFGDKNCSTALVGCQKHGCSEHSKCDPFLDAEEQHQYRCLCDSGYVGRYDNSSRWFLFKLFC